MAEQKASAEESFRESLKDVVTIAEKLTPYCQTIDDLVSMANLALENDGQLRLIMSIVASKR